MSGQFDYLLRVVASDAADYERIHRSRLSACPASSASIITALRTVKPGPAIRLKPGAAVLSNMRNRRRQRLPCPPGPEIRKVIGKNSNPNKTAQIMPE